jgi:hypothetical protein
LDVTSNDGVVNQIDVLPIGLCWNQTGPERREESRSWAGQAVAPWSPIASTYAAANGDGVVNQDDVLCIGLNWARTHSTATGVIAKQIATKPLTQASSAGLCYKISGDSTKGGEFWVEVSATSVTNVFGISFELLYSPTLYVDPQVVEVGSFMGHDPIFFPNIDKDTGKISVGISQKAPQAGLSGSGTRIFADAANGLGAVNLRRRLQYRARTFS